jgi:DNA-binding NtrC family response regulator
MDNSTASSGLVGRSLEFDTMLEKARKLAQLPLHIIITGESGTGKTALARFVHDASRASSPYVRVDCTHLRGDSLVSELFGHVKGAYTGATSARLGKVQTAQNGTVFLDEIGELDINVQAQLLTFLDDKEFQQKGGDVTLKSNARIIAGTNVDIDSAIKERSFRHELYARFKHRLDIKPLREKRDDIPCLFLHLWDRLSVEYRFTRRPERLEELSEELATLPFDWPFNVRSMERLMREAMLSAMPDEKRFTEYFRKELFAAMNQEIESKRESLQDELTDFITREISLLLSSKSDQDLNGRLQWLLVCGLGGALQKLMESGITLGNKRCTAIGKLLGHKALGNQTGGNPLEAKNAQYGYINHAFIGLYRSYSDTDLLRHFLGDELFQIVGKQAALGTHAD